MAVSISPFGAVHLTPTTGGVEETYVNTDLVFGQGMYRQIGTDVSVTLQSGVIERYRQSIRYEVTFETYGNDAGAASGIEVKQNAKCEVFEDDGTTPLGTTFYGSVKATYNESSRTTSWTVSGNAQAVPVA